MSVLAPTEQSPAQTAQASLKGVPPIVPQPSRRGRFAQRSRVALALYALMLPTIVGMIAFVYYPQFSAIKFSFYDWDGDTKQEPIGFKNFTEAFLQDTLFWQCFQLVAILLIANVIKMWPSILTAVVLHRIKSEKAQYIYRVLFVIPMIIPGLVMLLMWKSFYDPQQGILNLFLNKTGLMSVLYWLDKKLPVLANAPATVAIRDHGVGTIFGGVGGLVLVAIVLLSVRPGLRAIYKGWFWWAMLAAIGFVYWVVGETGLSGAASARQWVVSLLRLAVPLGLGLLISNFAADPRRERILTITRWVGGACLALAAALVFGTMIWTAPLPADPFAQPAPGVGAAPSWLGNSRLVIPAIIFWGFPWIGTVGVLIYLAGLESITTDVYEAAELDGVGSIGKFFSIELPLIMTQVRINLIFMTIGTLSDYGLMLLLLGPYGGPGNRGMVPGLYAYKAAFIDGRFGYACALGMVMFFIILFITIVYQKYVRVEK